MKFTYADKNQWPEIKKIYLEAFPKAERKPYLSLRHSVKKGKALLMTASENNQLLGFTVLIPYQDMVMVDYLAVSSRIRSRGTGSYIMEQVCKHFSDKKIVLLIERLDEILSEKRIFLLGSLYHRHKRRDGNPELRRQGFPGGISESSEICPWKPVFQAVPYPHYPRNRFLMLTISHTNRRSFTSS